MALPGNPNQILIFKYPLRFLSPSPAPPPVAWILFVIILIPAKHCIVKAGGGVCVLCSAFLSFLFFFFSLLFPFFPFAVVKQRPLLSVSSAYQSIGQLESQGLSIQSPQLFCTSWKLESILIFFLLFPKRRQRDNLSCRNRKLHWLSPLPLCFGFFFIHIYMHMLDFFPLSRIFL